MTLEEEIIWQLYKITGYTSENKPFLDTLTDMANKDINSDL